MKQFIKTLLPRRFRDSTRLGWYCILDLLDKLFRKNDPLIPPRRLMFDGPADPHVFKKNGEEFFKYFTEFCGLKPYHRILDVGCGMGRKTIPLLSFVNDEGTY